MKYLIESWRYRDLSTSMSIVSLIVKVLFLRNFIKNIFSGCNLYYLPTTLNTHSLKHVRMFENENLTHYPLVYEQYIPPMLHFTSPQKVLL